MGKNLLVKREWPVHYSAMSRKGDETPRFSSSPLAHGSLFSLFLTKVCPTSPKPSP